MDGDAELKGVADACRSDTGSDASPERGVQQDHIHRGIKHVCGKLLEIDYDGIRCQRRRDLFPHAAHPVHAEHGVLQVVVADLLYLAAEPYRSFNRPDAVWIETEAVAF